MKSRTIIFLLAILVGFGLLNLFTTEKERKELLRNVKVAFKRNPNIPRIEHKEISVNAECKKFTNNPDYKIYKEEAEDKCEKMLGSWVYSRKDLNVYLTEKNSCISKITKEPVAPKPIVLVQVLCNRYIGFEKWFTLFDIKWFRLFSKSYIDTNQERVQEIVADVTDDGLEERLITTVGKNCVSCHQNWIYVFSSVNKLFEMIGDDAIISILPTSKGFTITQPVRKENEAMCCPSQFTTDTYLWNGKQFIKQ